MHDPLFDPTAKPGEPEPFGDEHDALRRSWDQYPHDYLDRYLVADVEDPRINAQSILTRALLADTLQPDAFTDLIDAELRFGAVMTWLLLELKTGRDRYALLERIEAGEDADVPPFVRETQAWLRAEGCPVPDYIAAALADADPDKPGRRLNDPALDLFGELWRTALREVGGPRPRVLELACGSANDYRFLDRCGLAAHIDYCGIDIARRNIDNARQRHPGIDFRVGSAMATGLPDDAFDIVFVHDLYEHLSLEAMERALAETIRVARHEAWLHFFNLARIDAHRVQSVEHYHWNTLSLGRTCEALERLGGTVEVIDLPEFMAKKCPGYDYHNREATTLLVTKS